MIRPGDPREEEAELRPHIRPFWEISFMVREDSH